MHQETQLNFTVMTATNFPTPVSSTCTLLLGDATGLAIEAMCQGVPPTTAGIFQIGCRIIRSDAVQGLAVYTNSGTTAIPVWTQGSVAGSSAVGTNNMNVAHAIYSFAVDGGAIGAITPVSTVVIPANAIIVGATINSTTAVTSAGSATLAVGTTAGSSATSILAATAKASLSLDALINGVPVFATPVKMSAAGSIDVTVGTAVLTAGVVEIFVYYTVAANA